MKLLLVEDDVALSDSMVQILKSAGHDVETAFDGDTGMALASSQTYDVVILDVMLPGIDGRTIASELRRSGSDVPILMLTALAATADKVAGLDAGADDYLAKPFAPSEFLARLRALVRRRGEVVFERMRFGDLSLDLEGHDLSCDGECIHLRMKEFLLMRRLMESAPRVASKDSLVECAWGEWADGTGNSLEAHISFLRKKLRFLESCVSIEAVPKLGYKLVDGARA